MTNYKKDEFDFEFAAFVILVLLIVAILLYSNLIISNL